MKTVKNGTPLFARKTATISLNPPKRYNRIGCRITVIFVTTPGIFVRSRCSLFVPPLFNLIALHNEKQGESFRIVETSENPLAADPLAADQPTRSPLSCPAALLPTSRPADPLAADQPTRARENPTPEGCRGVIVVVRVIRGGQNPLHNRLPIVTLLPVLTVAPRVGVATSGAPSSRIVVSLSSRIPSTFGTPPEGVVGHCRPTTRIIVTDKLAASHRHHTHKPDNRTPTPPKAYDRHQYDNRYIRTH